MGTLETASTPFKPVTTKRMAIKMSSRSRIEWKEVIGIANKSGMKK